MATDEITAPTLGAQGEPCPTCGAPLASDQRYCLSCGTRRPEARLGFRDVLAGGAPGLAPAPQPPERADRTATNLTFLAGLACLLLALGVGVLIGRSGSHGGSNAAPQVISVGGAAPSASTTPSAGAGAAGAGSAATPKQHGKAAVSHAKGSGSSKATNKAVKDLNNLSTKDYQKKSAKLPKQVSTGGKPPPVDKSKPAGGGSGFQSIG
jgi:hypothetical protein